MKRLYLLVALISMLCVSCTKDFLDDLKGLIGGSDNESPNTEDIQIPHNQIWYTNGNTTEPTEPYATDVFGANIVSNTFDAEKERWVIEFDGDVTTIGDYAFAYCSSLTSVTIPDSVTTIGKDAFSGCSSLISVIIPDSVTTIGKNAFSCCYSLTSVTIGDSVTTIGEGAFIYCDSLTEFRGKHASEDGRCLIIDGTLNSFAPAGLTEYTIPDSVTTIEENAFRSCSSLTSVTIPDSVTTIEDYAFCFCSSLTSVTIPDGVTIIENQAFSCCYSLTSVTIGDSVTSIGEGAFQFCYSLTEFISKYASEDGRCLIIDGTLNSFAPAGLTEYTIPDSVTTIGDYTFSYCSSLTSVTIPDSVTAIGNLVFGHCESLTEFRGKYASEDGRCLIIDGALNSFAPAGLTEYTIPDSVTTIGGSTFYNCSSLTSVTIPDSVTAIGTGAFQSCYNLTSVTIGDSVTTIGDFAFYYCSSLTSVYCKAVTPPTRGYYMFDSNASGRKIYVPMESVEAYKSADGWSHYADAIEGYDF